MRHISTTIPNKNQQIEERIQQAILKLRSEDKLKIASVAREFDVPYQRLRARYKGQKSLFQRNPNGRKLNATQEKALCSWIDYNDTHGMAVKRAQLVAAAISILKLAETNPDSPPPTLSDKWLKRFL